MGTARSSIASHTHDREHTMEPSAVVNEHGAHLPSGYVEFDALFQASFDIISRYARLLVDTDHDAEVVVIDVYRSAWQRRDHILVDAAAVSKLLDITHDCAFTHLTKNRRSTPPVSPPNHPGTGQCTDIRAAIRHLSAKQQQVIVLCSLLGLSHREASLHLAIKPHAVRALQLHALRHLRLALDSSESNGDDHAGHDANAAGDRAGCRGHGRSRHRTH